jgi:hypothetical protein
VSWEAVDCELTDLAIGLGATQSPREAEFNAALDELAAVGLDIQSQDEALTLAAHREAECWWLDEVARRGEWKAS